MELTKRYCSKIRFFFYLKKINLYTVKLIPIIKLFSHKYHGRCMCFLSVQITVSAKSNMYQNKQASMGLLMQTDIIRLPRWLHSHVIRIHEMQPCLKLQRTPLQFQIRFYYSTMYMLCWAKSKFTSYPVYNLSS